MSSPERALFSIDFINFFIDSEILFESEFEFFLSSETETILCNVVNIVLFG